MRLSRIAQQSTLCPIGPVASKDVDSGKTPSPGIRVVVGFNPVMPQKTAGARVDPPVSVPIVAAAIPSAMETALPDDEPPATNPSSISRP
jgi:hypothetical protein